MGKGESVMIEYKSNAIILPDKIRGRSIFYNVIPTVCNLKNMLAKLKEKEGDYSQLKQWEKRSYQAYLIDKIKDKLLDSSTEEQKDIIRNHILESKPTDLGANCIDIYLVAYVTENYGSGKTIFFQYIRESGTSDKENSAQAIWQVGKGDGVFLNILQDNGTVLDWNFIARWIKGSDFLGA